MTYGTISKEGTFYHTAIVHGCHQWAAKLEDGTAVNSCWDNSYALQLVTYATDAGDIVGRPAKFCFDSTGILTDVRSVEGYTAQQLHGIKVRETIRLSAAEMPERGCYLQFGMLEQINRGKRKSDHRRLTVVQGAPDTLHLVTCIGPVELATPIFLAPFDKMPKVAGQLDTDEKVLAFEQRCHDLGNVYRRDGQTPWDLPSLDAMPAIPTRVEGPVNG